MHVDPEAIAISVEDVQNLRRMYTQQYKRLFDARENADGPEAGKALLAIGTCHFACADMYDVLEYVLTHWTPPPADPRSSEEM